LVGTNTGYYLYFKAIPTGIDFGTITVVYEGKNFEITTLRSDVNCDGRHAEVKFSNDFKQDAARRDFTFNALYMDIDGKIYDYFNGQKDLKAGVVRFIGNAKDRIEEDYLRILRMFRFHAKYGKGNILAQQIEISSNLKEGLNNISGERIHQEMFKLLSYNDIFSTINQMLASGILGLISSLNSNDFNIKALNKLEDVSVKSLNPFLLKFHFCLSHN